MESVIFKNLRKHEHLELLLIGVLCFFHSDQKRITYEKPHTLHVLHILVLILLKYSQKVFGIIFSIFKTQECLGRKIQWSFNFAM